MHSQTSLHEGPCTQLKSSDTSNSLETIPQMSTCRLDNEQQEELSKIEKQMNKHDPEEDLKNQIINYGDNDVEDPDMSL